MVLKGLQGRTAMPRAVRLLRRVTGPASKGCHAVLSLAQSIALRCVTLREHCIVSGVLPIEDAKGCACEPL